MFTGLSIELHDTDKYQPIQVKTTFSYYLDDSYPFVYIYSPKMHRLFVEEKLIRT